MLRSSREYSNQAYKYNVDGYRKDIHEKNIESFYKGGFQSRVVCNRCHKPDNVQMNLVQFIYSKMYCLNCLQVIEESERRIAGGKFSRQPTSNTDSNSRHMNTPNLQTKLTYNSKLIFSAITLRRRCLDVVRSSD